MGSIRQYIGGPINMQSKPSLSYCAKFFYFFLSTTIVASRGCQHVEPIRQPIIKLCDMNWLHQMRPTRYQVLQYMYPNESKNKGHLAYTHTLLVKLGQDTSPVAFWFSFPWNTHSYNFSNLIWNLLHNLTSFDRDVFNQAMERSQRS